jgi:hypothetical protein
MKTLIRFVLLLTSLTSTAFAEEYPNYVFTVDWDKKETLNDSIVQLCDDSYYPAVEIHVPGKALKNFYVELVTDITKGNPSLNCTVDFKQLADKGVYTIDSEYPGCIIRVRERVKLVPNGPKPRIAQYEISDAC